MPDSRKSCGCCCGLYNVADGTRSSLFDRLGRRTELFARVERTSAAILDYEAIIREAQPVPLDPDIHVCEFLGFVDAESRLVGCLLHPLSPGNRGIDLRGLCHYGSMACKAFYCPAWTAIAPRHREILMELLDDWHLYGLVVTDVDFVASVFGLAEERLSRPMVSADLADARIRDLTTRALAWKDRWPLTSGAFRRRSRYYFKQGSTQDGDDRPRSMERLLECLRFTFGKDFDVTAAEIIVNETFDELEDALKSGSGLTMASALKKLHG